MAILTISREYGSGGREIGQAVAESLAYEYVDKDKVLEDIRAVGHEWETWGKDLDEHCPTIWEKYDWSFRGFGALIESVVLGYAVKDRAVIVGRGGNFLLESIPHALRVRVVAPMEQRIARIARRESLDTETAKWLIERTNRERSCFLLALYGKRWDDPSEYDMVFDTGVRPVEETVLVIKEMLVEREAHNTEESRVTVRKRALAAKIKAGLLTDPTILIPVLDVIYDGKDIVLRGIVHNPKERKRIENAAKELAGETVLRNELHYRG
jgi:cytidylate kinase